MGARNAGSARTGRAKLSVTGASSQFPAEGSGLAFYMNGMTVFFEDVAAHVASIQPWLRAFEQEIGMSALIQVGPIARIPFRDVLS